MELLRILLLLCATAAAYSIPIPEDNDPFSREGDEAGGRLKQTVCLTLVDNSTSIARDKGELLQIFLLKSMVGRESGKPRPFKFRILTVDDSEELDVSSRSSLPNATFENDSRRPNNASRENVLRTVGSESKTNNITDVSTNVPDLINVHSMTLGFNETSTPLPLSNEITEIPPFRNIQGNFSGGVGNGPIFSKVNQVLMNETLDNDRYTMRPEIPESYEANNNSQNETITDVLKKDYSPTIPTPRINETIPISLNSSGNTSAEFDRESLSTDVNLNGTSYNRTGMSLFVVGSGNNSTLMANKTAPTTNAISTINNGTMIYNEVLLVNASLHHTNNDTNLSRNDTIAIRTNSTASSGNLNNNLTAEDSQHDLSGSDRENLKLISDSNTKINGNSEGGELLKTTVTRSPITTMGDDEHIGEMKNDSTSNSSIAPSRQDKALFSGEQNESLSDLPDGTNDDGPYGNNNVEPSTSSTPNGINSSILSEYTESQTAANQVSWHSENASDPITGNEEERFEFAESPSTTILTSNSTEKAISFNETEFDSPDYGRTTEAPQNGSPEYTSVQYSTHRTILPEPAIDWSTEVVTYSPVIQNSTPYDDAIRSDNVTEAPDVLGNSVNVEGPKIIGDGTTELTHETPRFENDLVTKTSNAATTWHVTSSFTTESTTIKPGYSSNNSSNGTVDLASAGTGEEQTTILEQTTTLNTTVKYQENVQNKTGKALTVGLPDATEGPQSIVTDVSGKVLFVESSESTESPDEAEEIFSNSSTASSQDLVIDEKTGEVMRVDSPESTENPDEDGTNVEVTTDRNNQDEVTSKSDSQISVSDIPIKMPGPSENIDNSEEHQNQTTETISTKSFEDIQVDDTTGNISNALSPESNDTLDEDEVMPTQGIEANQGKPNKPDASIEGEQEENHDEITQDINTNQGEPNPSDANIEGEQAENHDESTEESVDAGSAPTTVRVEIPSTEWITATPNQMPQLKIENALAPVEPTEDDSDVKFPTEPHPKYPPTLPQSQTQPPPTTKAPTTPRHTVVYEDWLKFNNFTIIFPTRASFHNRIIYDEQPSPVAGYEFANIYKRYDHPGFMQIVPLRPPRRRFNHF